MSVISKDKKNLVITDELSREIRDGVWGQSGDRFLSVRSLSQEKKISLVTAQQVMTNLKKRGLITIYGNSHYLTIGKLSKESPLYNLMQSKEPRKRPLIGIHFCQINNQFFCMLLKNLIDLCRHYGYAAIVMCSNLNSVEERHILKDFVVMGAVGVISCPNQDEKLYDVYKDYILPVVFLANHFSITNIKYTLVDDKEAARHVADHLMKMGYEHFLYIGLDNMKDDVRRTFFLNELNANGYPMRADNIASLSDHDTYSIPYSLKQRILRFSKPLGIFCYHDLIAIQLLIACENLGVKVPQDVGIVGFDDLTVATQINPSLTTVAYRFDRMAESAVLQLLQSIKYDNHSQNMSEEISYILKIRQSTARDTV